MAEDLNSIIDIIKTYLSTLKDKNIRVNKAYLFGSYAKGTAREHSDIDLALISEDFIGDRFDDRMKITPLRWNIDVRLEPMPYRPEDFNRPDPLVNEILDYGIEIKF